MKKTLLIVDDSRVSRMMIKAMLTDLDDSWQVIEAAEAEEALRIVEDTRPDAISVDYNMPGMDGLSLAEKLLQSLPEVPIALFTANIQSAIRERGAQVGVHFLPKPVTQDTVSSLLEIIRGG